MRRLVLALGSSPWERGKPTPQEDFGIWGHPVAGPAGLIRNQIVARLPDTRRLRAVPVATGVGVGDGLCRAPRPAVHGQELGLGFPWRELRLNWNHCPGQSSCALEVHRALRPAMHTGLLGLC